MSIIPRRPLDFGEILDAAFQLYRRDFFDYTIIAVVGLAPAYVAFGVADLNVMSSLAASGFGDTSWAGGFEAGTTAPAEAVSAMLSMTGWVALASVAVAVVWTALAAGITARARDSRPAFAPSYREAFRRSPAVLVAGVVAVLLVFAVTSVIGLVVVFVVVVASLATGNTAFGPVAAIAAAAVLTAPAAGWFMSSTFGVLPAVVVEGLGPFGALRRSFRLARGARLRIFGVLCVAWIMLTLPSLAFEFVAYGLWDFVADDPGAATSAGKYWLVNVGGLAIGSVTTPLLVSCMMMLYYDRRVRGEGYDLEAAADSIGADSSVG